MKPLAFLPLIELNRPLNPKPHPYLNTLAKFAHKCLLEGKYKLAIGYAEQALAEYENVDKRDSSNALSFWVMLRQIKMQATVLSNPKLEVVVRERQALLGFLKQSRQPKDEMIRRALSQDAIHLLWQECNLRFEALSFSSKQAFSFGLFELGEALKVFFDQSPSKAALLIEIFAQKILRKLRVSASPLLHTALSMMIYFLRFERFKDFQPLMLLRASLLYEFARVLELEWRNRIGERHIILLQIWRTLGLFCEGLLERDFLDELGSSRAELFRLLSSQARILLILKNGASTAFEGMREGMLEACREIKPLLSRLRQHCDPRLIALADQNLRTIQAALEWQMHEADQHTGKARTASQRGDGEKGSKRVCPFFESQSVPAGRASEAAKANTSRPASPR